MMMRRRRKRRQSKMRRRKPVPHWRRPRCYSCCCRRNSWLSQAEWLQNRGEEIPSPPIWKRKKANKSEKSAPDSPTNLTLDTEATPRQRRRKWKRRKGMQRRKWKRRKGMRRRRKKRRKWKRRQNALSVAAHDDDVVVVFVVV